MSDTLFDIPPSCPDPLHVARRRMDAAQKAYDDAKRADEECDGFGIIPIEIEQEFRDATRELRSAEAEALRKARQ